ncbi:hypothetical protein GCK72_017196 [Caenorhabditis remanei]|uniref:CX domain-containing protein n=1 Tax=Caenorhabditis remanei TaxID=31234 RepID=A0A6A5G7K4_CAERE|nr:hypothetical protein GCK72_017196 [Caenorhabditis remanei]KAF1750645.1 hypothetical protein GCK72_017196 [Caenorhabditis remanei]
MKSSVILFLFALFIVGVQSQSIQDQYRRATRLVRYNNINYYWYGNYVYDASHPLKCEYPIDLSADKEFQNVTYPDGSKPPSLQFGCLNYEDCCGLECCGDSRTSTVLICGIFLVTLASCVGYKKYQRYQIKKSDEMAMATTNSALQPLLDDTNIEVHAV